MWIILEENENYAFKKCFYNLCNVNHFLQFSRFLGALLYITDKEPLQRMCLLVFIVLFTITSVRQGKRWCENSHYFSIFDQMCCWYLEVGEHT